MIKGKQFALAYIKEGIISYKLELMFKMTDIPRKQIETKPISRTRAN